MKSPENSESFLSRNLQAALTTFIENEKLPSEYIQTVAQGFVPLTQDITERASLKPGPFILGIHGCQGSGKSTLAALLVILFREIHALNSINLSLDDFYLTRAEREELANRVHPLFITRGVPGTHDVSLAMQTLQSLGQSGLTAIPRFDKSIDDRVPESEWGRVETPVDIIILEGWCLGISPQRAEDMLAAINDFEAKEDDGTWRSYVNKRLEHEYQELFARLDMLVMLKAPDFSHVLQWRTLQEEKLREKNKGSTDKTMNQQQLVRFISHYERLTRHALITLPDIADVVFLLNDSQGIEARIKG